MTLAKYKGLELIVLIIYCENVLNSFNATPGMVGFQTLILANLLSVFVGLNSELGARFLWLGMVAISCAFKL